MQVGTSEEARDVPEPDPEEVARRVLDVTRQVTLELHPHRRRELALDLDSALDRDLGFDSLSRVELLMRMERTFHLRFPRRCWPRRRRPATWSRRC